MMIVTCGLDMSKTRHAPLHLNVLHLRCCRIFPSHVFSLVWVHCRRLVCLPLSHVRLHDPQADQPLQPEILMNIRDGVIVLSNRRIFFSNHGQPH